MLELVGGRFELEREAGAGAMARVYRARDITTGEIVAVKVLHDVSESTLRRFGREVAALSELAHPSIVRYVSHGRTNAGAAFLAMEWCDGETLDERLVRGSLSIADTLVMGRAVADALGAAHARGIVHRDVKPANLFLVGGDVRQPKLLDFGLVREVDASLALTNAGDLLGTPLYMAPEQASGELALDTRVDVYALGAVLYHCITSRPPILGRNLVGLLAKIVLDEPAPASTLQPETPEIVDELLVKLLAKHRDARPSDGRATAAEIDRVLAELSHTTISPRRSRPALPVREQRVVSILLASANRSADAESLDATMGSFGGALALADGSTMVVFDGPETPVDLASRAARYALGMRSPASAVSLATGRAVLSGPTPVGEVIERAAEHLARSPGQIRIDRETAALVEGRFELQSDDHGAILVGERAGELDPIRTLLGKPTRCVGRDRELAAIEGYFAEVAGESVARVVIVVAEAGVGKSRLAHEVQRRLAVHSEPPAIVVARCESISERSPFAAIAAALRRAAGIEPSDPSALRAERLAAMLSRDGLDARDARTGGHVFEFLAELLAIPDPQPSERLRAARENPALMFESIRTAWTAWLGRACAQRPVLLVIEDVHWADESSVLLVDAALAALAEERLFVLALARPEVRERRPWSARRPHELRLDPLARRASERLVREALGAGADDRAIAEIVARAEGNALFLEELIRAREQSSGGELPLGVIGTVQRRFDALSSEARIVLRAASIFGERFTTAGVTALVRRDVVVGAALDQLVAAELVARQEGHAGYAFRHALVREAAYALLADDDRALGHALAAERLERDSDHDAAVIAWHYEAGRRFADAARWYAAAAERALSSNDLSGARAHAERAQRWTTEPAALGRLDLVVAEVEFWRGHLEQAREAAERATARLPRASAAWFEAAGLIVTTSGQIGNNAAVADWLAKVMDEPAEPEALSAYVLCLARGCSQLAWDRNAIARRALERADAVDASAIGPAAAARLQMARAYVHFHDGRFDAGIEDFAEVAAKYRRIGAARDELQAEVIGSVLSAYGGHAARAHDELLAWVAKAERLEARYIADWARWASVLMLYIKGDRARAEAEMVHVRSFAFSQPLFRDVSIVTMSWAAFADDDIAALVQLVEDDGRQLVYERFRAAMAGFAAYVQLARDPEAACKAARRAIATLVEARGLYADGAYLGMVPAIATLVEAGAADAQSAIAEHTARLDAIGTLLRDDAARAAFRALSWNAKFFEIARRGGAAV